ncbi:MAG: hypothetical protein V9F00_03380 [Nocardioides sp.]
MHAEAAQRRCPRGRRPQQREGALDQLRCLGHHARIDGGGAVVHEIAVLVGVLGGRIG